MTVFTCTLDEISADSIPLVGGKGANLGEMAMLGLPVPPGFTITTEVCEAFFAAGNRLSDALKSDVMRALDAIGDSVRDARDRALLLIGFAGGFRRSE